MKWTPKPRFDEEKDYSCWHTWFAWHPVKVDKSWIWLEKICRKQHINYRYSFFDKITRQPIYSYTESILDVIKESSETDEYL